MINTCNLIIFGHYLDRAMNNSVTPFIPIGNRDAWSTIRGYVYQVNQTILKWLELDANERLELEKGEDYDLIKDVINGNPDERELAQIKHRDSNFTLNSETVIESIINFYLHRVNNPGKKLLFKFVTNTAYATERPALLPKGKAGIEAWNELHSSSSWDAGDIRFSTIRKHLHKKISVAITKIKDDNSAHKKLYEDVLGFLEGKDDTVIDFIRSFSWNTAKGSKDGIVSTIKENLAGKGIDKSMIDALYARLFLFVFKTLSERGEKFLDTAKLKEQLEMPELSTSDETLVLSIAALIGELGKRINDLEKQVSEQGKDISLLLDKVGDIEKVDAVFEYARQTFSIDPPPLLINGSARSDKVLELRAILEEYSWIAFTGTKGSGKTQLAALLARTYPQSYWIDLRAFDLVENKSSLLLEQFLAFISGKEVSHYKPEWIADVAGSLPASSVIIINDLPQTSSTTGISSLLILLANQAKKSGIKLITTSNYPIHSDIRRRLSDIVYQQYDNFNLSQAEIQEYLDNNGITGYNEYVDMISAVTANNPRLVTAMVYYLKENVQAGSVEKIKSLLGSQFPREVLADAQLEISSHIPDSDTKALLYRLSLIHWAFETGLVTQISAVTPSVRFANEKMQRLLNIWIQEEQTKYLVSPIIHDIGRGNLDKQELIDTYTVIAKDITSKKVIDHITAARAIWAYVSAEKYNEAGLILIKVYQSAKRLEDVKFIQSWGYLGYWKNLRLPPQMNVSVRCLIRTEQKRIGIMLDEDAGFAERELESYFSEPGITIRERAMIRISQLASFDATDENFLDKLTFVLENWASFDMPGIERVDIRILGNVAWVPMRHLDTRHKIDQWLKLIGTIKELTNEDLLDYEIGPSAISVLANNMVVKESDKPGQDHNWAQVIETLEYLYRYFFDGGKEVLAAVVMREILTVTYRGLRKTEYARELAGDAMATYTSKTAVFKVADMMGRLYLYDDRGISQSYFSEAIGCNCIEDSLYSETLIYAAAVYSDIDKQKALGYSLLAKDIVETNFDYSEIDALPYLAEIGIAYWKLGDNEKSFHWFDLFVKRLFSLKKENFDSFWKNLLNIGGHTLGYISLLVARGERLNQVQGSDYVEPFQGFFVTNNHDFSGHYKEFNDPLIMVHMALFAEGIGDLSSSGAWATAAFDLARKFGDAGVTSMISTSCSLYTLINFKFDESFEQYQIAALSYSLAQTIGLMDYQKMNGDELFSLINDKRGAQWSTAEDRLVDLMILPACILLSTAKNSNASSWRSHSENFIRVIRDYISQSHKPELWEKICQLLTVILLQDRPETQLKALLAQYAASKETPLQILSIIGLINISSDHEYIVQQLANIMPYITKESGDIKVLNARILVPFVKSRLLFALRKGFVGEKKDLLSAESSIEHLGIKAPDTVKNLLKTALAALDIAIADPDRRDWLYESKLA